MSEVRAVRTGQSERSRQWTKDALVEQAERDERAEAKRLAPIRALEAELNHTHQEIAKESARFEQQQLRYRLGHEPSEFTGTPYDGRFKEDRTAMENAVKDAGTACMQRYGLKDSEPNFKLLVDFVTVNAAKIDVSLAESWFASWRFVCKAFEDLEKSLTPELAPEPEPAVELSKVEQRRRELTAKRDEKRPGSEAYNKADHDLMVFETQEEVIFKDAIHDILEEIVEQSGLAIPQDCNLKFRNWLGAPMQRRFDSSRESVRLAFSEFTQSGDTFLTPEEFREIDRRKRVGALTSDQVKEITGATNTYGGGSQPGIRR